jgi:hypothetical protein
MLSADDNFMKHEWPMSASHRDASCGDMPVMRMQLPAIFCVAAQRFWKCDIVATWHRHAWRIDGVCKVQRCVWNPSRKRKTNL